jgi:hypothetical protein
MIAADLSALVRLAREVVRADGSQDGSQRPHLYQYRATMGRGVSRPVSMAARVWVAGLMDAGVAVTFAVIST